MVRLLAALNGSDLKARLKYYSNLQNGRRRDRNSVTGTPVDKAFHHRTAKHLRRLLAMAARFREAVRLSQGSLDAAFKAYDTNNDGFLSPAELEVVRLTMGPGGGGGHLRAPGVRCGPAPHPCVLLLAACARWCAEGPHRHCWT